MKIRVRLPCHDDWHEVQFENNIDLLITDERESISIHDQNPFIHSIYLNTNRGLAPWPKTSLFCDSLCPATLPTFPQQLTGLHKANPRYNHGYEEELEE
jgi:hypothetical protein